MRVSILCFLSWVLLESCDTKEVPRVSALESKVDVGHFDHAFFAMNSAKLDEKLILLEQDFPKFFESSQNNADLIARYKDPQIRELFSAVDSVFTNPEDLDNDIKDAFKYFHYYFPAQDSLQVYTWVSNFESLDPIIVSGNTLLIALDLYLGEGSHFYNSAPDYIKKTFEKKYLISDLLHTYFQRNIPISNDNTLLASMLYYGKIHYLASLMMPGSKDPIVMKYTDTKMQWCKENEANVWAYFIENKLLFSSEYQNKQRFIEDAPFSKFFTNFDVKTPGRIGQWIGWQLVKSYMDVNPEVSLNELINEQNAQKILRKSHYKPKN